MADGISINSTSTDPVSFRPGTDDGAAVDMMVPRTEVGILRFRRPEAIQLLMFLGAQLGIPLSVSANEAVPPGTTVILVQSMLEEGPLGSGVLDLRLVGTASDHQPLAWTMDVRLIASEARVWRELAANAMMFAGEKGMPGPAQSPDDIRRDERKRLSELLEVNADTIGGYMDGMIGPNVVRMVAWLVGLES